MKSLAYLWYMRKKYYNISPGDKMCFFYTIHNISDISEGDMCEDKNALGFSKSKLDNENLVKIYQKMEEYKPKWLLLQPSTAYLLCECKKKNNLPDIDSIQYVELSGEILTQDIRNSVIESFKCMVANQYGANEFNSIAYECPCGNLHILSGNVYVEVMNKDVPVESGKEGDLYISTLTNRAMPLIRYKIGDIGKIDNLSKCKCCNTDPILVLTSGRSNDWVICKDGSKALSNIFVKAIDIVNLMTDGIIKQFQIIQKAIDKFDIKIVVDEDDIEIIDIDELKDTIIDKIDNGMIKSSIFEIEIYDTLFPEETNGKFKYFINNIVNM